MKYSACLQLVFFSTLTTASYVFSIAAIAPANASSVQTFNQVTPEQFVCMREKRIKTVLGTYQGQVKGKNKGTIAIAKKTLWNSQQEKVADLSFNFNPSTQKLVLKLHKFYELGGDEQAFWNYANEYVINPCRQQ